MQDTLDRSGSFALVVLAEAQALALYGLQLGRDDGVAMFSDPAFVTLAYSLILLPCSVVSLTLRSATDRYGWLAGAGSALLTLPAAWHTGHACVGDGPISCAPIAFPYVLSMLAAAFIALPFAQAFRDHGARIPYAALFHSAWDNALTGAAALFFTGAAWLILLLWAALFKLVGVAFFSTLFQFAGFYYPVTGLLAGIGIVLARHQAGALQAVLSVCLALGRALLPLINVLAICFLGALVFTGVQPLWDTRSATALLLLLVFGTVALVNGVLHDGTGAATVRPTLRRLLAAALLTLPVYAVIAAIALGLRVHQYAWTVERLWAALLVFIAGAYAFAYAASVVLRRGEAMLSLLPRANIAVALLVGACSWLTQTPLLDFRAITVRNQLALLDSGAVTPEKFDVPYFRWELGRPGYEALQALAKDPHMTAKPEVAKAIGDALASKEPWAMREARRLVAAADLKVLPAGLAVPDGLLEAINHRLNANLCRLGHCTLLAVDLDGDAAPEWVLMDPDSPWMAFRVYQMRNGHWAHVASIDTGLQGDALAKALATGDVRAEAPVWRDLQVGSRRLRLTEVRDWEK